MAKRPTIWCQIHSVLFSGLGPPSAEPEARGLIWGERWPSEAGVENWESVMGKGEKARARWGIELIMVPMTVGSL